MTRQVSNPLCDYPPFSTCFPMRSFLNYIETLLDSLPYLPLQNFKTALKEYHAAVIKLSLSSRSKLLGRHYREQQHAIVTQ